MSCEYVSKKTGIKCECRSVRNSGLCGRHRHDQKRRKKPYDDFEQNIPQNIPENIPQNIPENIPENIHEDENIIIPIIDTVEQDEETNIDIDELLEYITTIFDKRYMPINSSVTNNNNNNNGSTINNILTSKPMMALGLAIIPLILKRLNISDIYNNASDLTQPNKGFSGESWIGETQQTRKDNEPTTTSTKIQNEIQTGKTETARPINDESIRFAKLKL